MEMNRMMDIHMHTIYSDGDKTVEEVLKMCEKRRLEYISITDHDTCKQYDDEALKYNKPLIERIITFSGESLEKPSNVLVKIGTPVHEILDELKIKPNSIIVAGGPMMGNKVEDLVVSANLNCVLALNDDLNMATPCLECGKCVSVCPVKLSPVLIMKTKYKKEKDIKKFKVLHPEQCIGCGLCSYICPAKLFVRERVKEAKNIIRGDK